RPLDHRLAIRPYPNQYTHSWLLDGQEVTIRVIRPEDEPLIEELFSSFSEYTVRMRYFSLIKRLSKDSLIRFCHLDYEREMALVAVDRDDGRPRLLGVSRYYMEPESHEAEYSIVVGDLAQRKGLGRHLMERLIVMARENGVRRLTGPVLSENTAMLG